MAIFSLNHRPISKQKNPGLASSHVRYISRGSASPVVLSARMPTDPQEARRWLKDQEQKDRKNARVADRIMIALPVELSPNQRADLVQKYCETITKGEAAWYLAIHQEGKDSNNPHAHILIRDRSAINGRRIAKLSEKGSTTLLRELWTETANKALQDAGHNTTIDHRSLEAQGIDRQPTKHKGPKIPWARKIAYTSKIESQNVRF
jgi:hypothetical protein